VIVCVQFSSVGAGTVGGGGSSLHSGIEFGRSRTGEGSSGGEGCVFVYYCSTYYKAVREGGGGGCQE
jgi:hypothetical protein